MERSTEAVKQARAAVAAVTSQLEQFHDLDIRIATARAGMGERAATGTLPPSLNAEREERRAARERQDECSSALTLLESQHAAAEKERRDADVAHSVAALEVMLDEASALSSQLLACHEMLWRRADTLAALDYVVMGAAVGLPPAEKARVHGLLGRVLLPLQTVRAQRQELPLSAPRNPERLAGERWQALYAELKCDPDVPVRPVWDEQE